MSRPISRPIGVLIIIATVLVSAWYAWREVERDRIAFELINGPSEIVP